MNERRLRALPAFAALDRNDLARVARVADEVDVREGEELLHEGAFAYEFMVVALDHARRTASVVAATPMTLVVMTARDLRQLTAMIPALGDELRAIAERCHPLALQG